MALTDKQLEIYKDLAQQQQKETNIDMNAAVWIYANLYALLARLEAAEKLAEWVWQWENHSGCEKKCALENNIDAWRKEAGK